MDRKLERLLLTLAEEPKNGYEEYIKFEDPYNPKQLWYKKEDFLSAIMIYTKN